MTTEKQIEQQVLETVRSKQYRPVKPRQIFKKLKLEDEKLFKKLVKRLIRDGRLVYGPKHLILAGAKHPKASKPTVPKSKGNERTGIYRRASAGYGFVTPVGASSKDRSEDVFIPRNKSADASNGDKVRIQVSRRREGARDRFSGHVVEVLERRTHQFVGTYGERGESGFVKVDNGVFDSEILVGDANAKNCRVGDKVVIEMANFPSPTEEGEGVIVEVLGERGQPGVDTLMVIREFDLPGEFPEAVLQDAREQAEKFDESIGEDRTDFTKDTVVTIDPKTARDFDDAISIKELENGHWELGVHIADVSHFVPYRSDLDNEAYARATSVYLPDRVIPMLPEIISNNLASLQPHRVRYTTSAVIEFSAEGIPIATELHRGAIKSAHRFNYEEIDDYLADDLPWKDKLEPEVFRTVREMHTLAMILRKRRMARGSIDLALPEVRIDLDEDGRVCGAHTEQHTESHQVIEEFMLAANEAVAQRMVDEELYLMRRIHEAPSEAKLKTLTQFVRSMGIDCESLESRFEIKRVIADSLDMPESRAIQFAILRSMQKAIYSPREIGHYALASKAYCHFTSPIRRYPDLIIHRMVADLVAGKKPSADFDRLTGTGEHCSDLERRAEQAERELKKLKLLNYLVDKIGMEMEAVVTGVEPYGLFAQGVELPAEGLVPIANLPTDSYHFDRDSRTIAGHRESNQFRLGDRLKVRVSLVDPDQRELEFELVGVQDTGASRKRKPRPQRIQERDRDSNRKRDSVGEPSWEERRANGPTRRNAKKSKSKKKLTAKKSKKTKSKKSSKPKNKSSSSKPSRKKSSKSSGKKKKRGKKG